MIELAYIDIPTTVINAMILLLVTGWVTWANIKIKFAKDATQAISAIRDAHLKPLLGLSVASVLFVVLWRWWKELPISRFDIFLISFLTAWPFWMVFSSLLMKTVYLLEAHVNTMGDLASLVKQQKGSQDQGRDSDPTDDDG